MALLLVMAGIAPAVSPSFFDPILGAHPSVDMSMLRANGLQRCLGDLETVLYLLYMDSVEGATPSDARDQTFHVVDFTQQALALCGPEHNVEKVLMNMPKGTCRMFDPMKSVGNKDTCFTRLLDAVEGGKASAASDIRMKEKQKDVKKLKRKEEKQRKEAQKKEEKRVRKEHEAAIKKQRAADKKAQNDMRKALKEYKKKSKAEAKSRARETKTATIAHSDPHDHIHHDRDDCTTAETGFKLHWGHLPHVTNMNGKTNNDEEMMKLEDTVEELEELDTSAPLTTVPVSFSNSTRTIFIHNDDTITTTDVYTYNSLETHVVTTTVGAKTVVKATTDVITLTVILSATESASVSTTTEVTTYTECKEPDTVTTTKTKKIRKTKTTTKKCLETVTDYETDYYVETEYETITKPTTITSVLTTTVSATTTAPGMIISRLCSILGLLGYQCPTLGVLAVAAETGAAPPQRLQQRDILLGDVLMLGSPGGWPTTITTTTEVDSKVPVSATRQNMFLFNVQDTTKTVTRRNKKLSRSANISTKRAHRVKSSVRTSRNCTSAFSTLTSKEQPFRNRSRQFVQFADGISADAGTANTAVQLPFVLAFVIALGVALF